MRFWLGLCCVLLLSSAFSSKLAAQSSDTSTVTGTVTDNTGAVIPTAVVTVVNVAGIAQTGQTNEKGEFEINGLAPGTYSVKISVPGMKDFEAKSVALAAGQTARIDAVLVPAEVQAQVNVEGQTVTQVETESSQIVGTITEKEVVSVGLNGRNFTQLAALAPGVSNQTGQDEALVGIKGSVKYSVNGGRVEYNTFDVDGGDVLNPLNAQTTTLIVYPSLDAIQELQVLTSNYGAMYGRSASGTILATTKAGGSDFHGDGYFFARNNIFNDRNYFDETAHAPTYQKYDPGGTIGGPLFIPNVYNEKKDKTFFFFSEEYRHDKEPTEFNQGVPSAEERDCSLAANPNIICTNPVLGKPGGAFYGDFSDVCPPPSSPIPFTRSAAAAKLLPFFPDCPGVPTGLIVGGSPTYTTFFDNLINYRPNPTQFFNPYKKSASTAAALLLGTGIIPMPNSSLGCNSSINSCYDETVSPLTTWRQELFRIDHNFTHNLKGTFRFVHDAWTTAAVTPLYAYIQNSFPTIENDVYGPGISMIAHFSQTFSATFVNDFAFGFTADHIRLTDIPGPGATITRPAGLDAAMNGLFNNGFGGKLPGLVLGGTNAAYGGFGFAVDPAYMPWRHSNPTYSPRDDANVAIGRHTLDFGFLAVLAQRNEINPPVGANTGDIQGLVNFSNLNNFQTTGNVFADFLQGGIRSFQQDSTQFLYHNNYTIWEPYVQDDWHVTKRLTVNLGLRLSLFGLWHETNHNTYNWESSAFSQALAQQVSVDPIFGELQFVAPPGLVPLNPSNLDPHILNGVVRCTNGSCMKGHLVNPAPRIGFAWDPFGTGKTSIRGGYGIFYEHGVGNEANTGSLEGSPANFPNGVVNALQNTPPGWLNIGALSVGGFPAAYPINVTAIPTKVQWPYIQQWSLSVQRDLPMDSLATFAYVASKGTHLTAELQLNQLQPVPASQNPFPAGVPLTLPTCSTFSGIGGSFTIFGPPPNDTMIATVGANQPAFTNIEAACYGSAVVHPIPDPNSLREFAPGIGQIYALSNVANSNYEAFQFTLKRTKGPLTIGLSYTYSHSLDNASDRTDPVLNSFDLRENYASSNFDERHLFNVDYIWDIPVARLLNAVLFEVPSGSEPGPYRFNADSHPHLLKGWQLSGITLYASGTPFSVINGGSSSGTSFPDNAGVASGAMVGTTPVESYPDVIHPSAGIPLVPSAKGQGATEGPLLANPFEFTAPRGLTFGDAGRNFLNNPSRLNFDISLLKTFKTSERTSLQFRAESYNFFNHTQFRIYDPSRPGIPGNNVITCYGGAADTAGDSSCLAGNSFLHPIDAHRPRTVQLGLKFLF